MLADLIDGIDGLTTEPPSGGVRTNMVYFQVDPELGDARSFANAIAAHGVAMLPIGPQRIRAVLHLDVSSPQVTEAARAMADAAASVAAAG